MKHETKVEVTKCEAEERLGDIRATLLVNFGPGGRNQDGITISPHQSEHAMMFDVLKQYQAIVSMRSGWNSDNS